MSIQWLDLSAYHLKLEAWEDRAGKYHLVAFGDTDIHQQRLKQLGGRRMTVLRNPDVEAWVAPMPPAERAQETLSQWSRVFPKLKHINADPLQVIRRRSEQLPDRVRPLVADLVRAAADAREAKQERQGRWVHIGYADDGRVMETSMAGTDGARVRVVLDAQNQVLRTESPEQARRDRVDASYARPGPVTGYSVEALRRIFLAALRARPEVQWDQRLLTRVLARCFDVSLEAMVPEQGFRERPVQEAFEAALVDRARDLVQESGGQAQPRTTYEALLDLYEHQPKLGVRSGSSIQHQQFSTPVIMSWLAQYAVALGPDDRVFEPAAGNGSLLTEARPDQVVGWEIDPVRQAAVAARYPGVRLGDFLEAPVLDEPADVLLVNPPFAGLDQEVRYAGTINISRMDRLFTTPSAPRRGKSTTNSVIS